MAAQAPIGPAPERRKRERTLSKGRESICLVALARPSADFSLFAVPVKSRAGLKPGRPVVPYARE